MFSTKRAYQDKVDVPKMLVAWGHLIKNVK